MSKFVLTAQLKLQAPKNTQQVVNQIKSQLSGVSVNVNVKGATQAQRQIKQITAATNQATSAAHNMGKTFGVALKRFAAFTIASRAVSLFTNSLAGAVQESIDFQREIIKIAQVTGKTTKELKGLSDEISRLSSTLGTSSQDLVAVTRILAQAGIQAGDLKTALEALAKTTLAPTFEDINKTAEGAVAILAQFGRGVGQLERQLGAINAVAGQFAVESGDLIGAVRRFGGVFKAAGGDLNELIALFTSVRATTRESSESIATGLRTIFTRLQRPSTIQFLKELGVELTTADGRFVGAYEAVRRLSKAMRDIPAGDLKFIQIAEELGGFRQIGKVIPLLQQFETAEKARQAAIAGGNSLSKDAATAQQALAVQIVKVKEEFFALVRGITESTSFQVMTKTALSLASALIKVADALKPIIPLLGAFAAVKISQGIGGFAAGIGASLRGVKGKHQGGQIHHFARGGSVPGTGNRDTVPAMLQPGEFVIRKSSVKKIGTDQLQAMNNNKYGFGGVIEVNNPRKYGALVMDSKSGLDIAKNPVEITGTARKRMNEMLAAELARTKTAPSDKDLKNYANSLSAKEQRDIGLSPTGRNPIQYGKKGFPSTPRGSGRDAIAKAFAASGGGRRKKGEHLDFHIQGPFSVFGIGHPEGIQKELGAEFSKASAAAISAGSQSIYDGKLAEIMSVGPIKFTDGNNFKVEQVLEGAGPVIEGYLLEAVMGALGDMQVGMGKSAAKSGIRPDFDFPNVTKSAKKRLRALFDPNDDLSQLKRADAKRTRETAVSGDGRLVNKIAKDLKRESFTLKRAAGGGIPGSDTVPALLTPGEFVVNKKSARSIGYANLNRMNKKGVTGFAAGGPVGVQTFAKGGEASGGGGLDFDGMAKMAMVLPVVTTMIAQFGDKSKEASEAQFATAVGAEALSTAVTQLVVSFGAIGYAVKGFKEFGKSLEESSKKTIQEGKEKLEASKKGMTVDELRKEKKAQEKAKKKAEKQAAKKKAEEEAGIKESTEGTKKKKKKKKKIAKKEAEAKKEEEKAAEAETSAHKTDVETSEARSTDDLAKEQDIARHEEKERVVQSEVEHEEARRARLKKEEEVGLAEMGEAEDALDPKGKLKQREQQTAEIAHQREEQFRSEKREERRLLGEKEADAEALTSADAANRQARRAQREHAGAEEARSPKRAAEIKAKQAELLKQQKAGGFGAGIEGASGTTPEMLKLQDEIAALEKESKEAARATEQYAAEVNQTESNLESARSQASASEQAYEEQVDRTTKARAKAKKSAGKAKTAQENLSAAEIRAEKAKNRVLRTQNAQTATEERLTRAQRKAQQAAQATAIAKVREAKSYHPAVRFARKHTRAMQQLINEQKRNLSVQKPLKSAIALTTMAGLKARQMWGRLRGVMRHVPKDAGKARSALLKLNAQMKAMRGGRMARAKGLIGKGLGGLASAGGAITGVLTTAAIAAQAMADASKQIADRRLEQAKDRGDFGGAVKAAKAGALAETMGETLSFGGIMQMMMDSEGFIAGQLKRKENAEADAALAVSGKKQEKMLEGVRSGEKGEFIAGDGSLNVAGFGKAFAAESSRAMQEINDTSGEAKEERVAKLKKNEGAMAVAMGKGAKSANELQQAFQNMEGQTATAKQKLLEMAMSAFKVAEANRAVAKANFDNLKVMSAFAASSNAVNNFLASLETGSLSLESTIATIETAQSNMGMGAEGKKALEDARSEVLNAVGGDKDSAVGKAVGRSFDRAQGVNDFMGSLQQRVSGLDLSQGTEAGAKQDLEAALLKGVGDKETQTAISGAIANLGDIRGKDVSSLVEEIKSGLDPLRKTALESAKAVLEHQKTIVALTKARRESELAYIAAQKQAIDVQLEAAKIFESFGGDKLSSEQKEQARVAQFNLVAQDAGIKTLRNASAGELARAREEVAAKTDVQMARRASGGFQGAGGVDADRTKELAATNKALMTLTKQRIGQIKEEIAIIAKKNAAERSSFEKLMAGDIEGFIEQQAAAGAAAALRAGDANMAGMFSPSALGAGLKSLEGTGMSDAEMQRAAGITLSTMGITGAGAAGVMVGRDAETEALKAEGRGLAAELGAQAQQMADVQRMEVAAKEVTITNAKVVFEDTMQQKVAQQEAAERRVGELGMARGGVVYANRGIFVPRGTDTVPAMLTPGEFVVNRAAVNRGNNLQILRAMNSNGRQDATAPAAMSGGGQVGYYQHGDLVRASSAFSEAMPAMTMAVNSFASAIEKLTGFSMGVDINSMPPISVNVVLPKLEPAIKDIVLDAVSAEIPKYKATNNGLKKIAGMGE